jgi:hypothetical protein
MKESVPGSITVNTGGQERIAQLIDQFMQETVEAVKSLVGAHEHDFRIESGELSDGPSHVTDNRSTYLKYKERVVAVIMETRTELNFVRYDFFRNLEGLKKARRG